MQELWARASCQLGLVTAAQAVAAVGQRGLAHRLQTGELVRVRNRVFRLAAVPPSPWEAAMAACLAAGADAVAGFVAGAAVWGMGGLILEQPEIIVPAPRCPRLPGVIVHSSTLLPEEHRVVRHGIPVASAA